jgi:hypothetical protein
MSGGAVIALILGVGLIVLALYELVTKRAYLRFSVARRGKEPGLFWFAVTIKVALGFFIIFTVTWRLVSSSFGM